jgi:hypothetical protein
MKHGQVVELLDADLLAETTETTEICLCPTHEHHEQGQSAWSCINARARADLRRADSSHLARRMPLSPSRCTALGGVDG